MPVFVRAESEDPDSTGPPEPLQSREPGVTPWSAGIALTASSLVSLSKTGPFGPLGLALLRNDRLRSELAHGLDVAQVKALARVRFLAPLLALPLLWLAWVDYTSDDLSPTALHASARVMWPVLDVLAALAAVYDASQRSPHRRWLAFALVVGGVARLLNQSAENCTLFFAKSAHGSVGVAWTGAGLSLAALAVLGLWLSRTAAPRLVARQVLDALEIDVDAVLALPEPPAPRVELAVLVGGAALAMCAASTFLKERPLAVQAAAALLLSLGAATIARRLGGERGVLPSRPMLGRANGAHVLVVGVLGFLGAAFAARAIQQGFDAGGNLLRCRDLPSFEASGAKRQLLLETVEMLSARARARDTWANAISTVAGLPLAYELFFRGALQRVIARRYSGTSGLFVGALAYAVAASMTYESLFYRTLAAGLAFGVIYAEVGVYAAILAHVLYAAHLLV